MPTQPRNSPQKKRVYKRSNRAACNADNAMRRAAKVSRTPKWSELAHIKAVYMNCPEGYHVDHILPLRGKTVSGLHVLDNLQWLPAEVNIRKGNKMPGESS